MIMSPNTLPSSLVAPSSVLLRIWIAKRGREEQAAAGQRPVSVLAWKYLLFSSASLQNSRKAVLFLKFETGSSPGFTMSYNQIIKKKVLGTITKNGAQITLSAATQTSNWTRPEFAIDGLKDDFEKAVNDYTGPLPEDTAEICARFAEGL
jgi:hypothetical protein